MIKVLLFLAALVLSMFVILYSELTWQLIIVYGKKKMVLNLWFAMLVILLVYLTVHYILKKIGFIFKLPNAWREYQWKRRIRDKEYARGQGLMYSLTGNYKAALGHMPVRREQTLSDLILLATWLNQLQEIKKLDVVLGHMVAMNKIPDGWMIWFRSYLLYTRGKAHLAADILLDAIESREYTSQIIKSFVEYADPKMHFKPMLLHYPLLLRYVKEAELLPKLLSGALVQMNQLVTEKKWDELSHSLQSLPKKIRKNKQVHYFWVHQLLAEGQQAQLLTFLMSASFVDDRIIPLLANIDLPIETKIEIVSSGLMREPNNKNLLYLLSYFHAQSGSVDDTVKMLESAISKAS